MSVNCGKVLPLGSVHHSIHTDYWFGDTVYLRVRSDRHKGMITGIRLWPDGLAYNVTWGYSGAETPHYGMELTSEFESDLGVI
jgi:hypothetical protein